MPYCSECKSVIDSNFCADCNKQVGSDTVESGSSSLPEGRRRFSWRLQWKGGTIDGGSDPLPEDGNVSRPNVPAGHMRVEHKRNFPQRDFMFWLIISVAILPLAFPLERVNVFLIPVIMLYSGITYGVYTYYLMVDFTKYVEDMKRKGKLANIIELPSEATWLFPFFIVTPCVVQSLSFIAISQGPAFFFMFFVASPLLYCASGMIFLYFKHRMMEDISLQIVKQNTFRTPISVRDSKRPLINIGVLYACLFLYVILVFFNLIEIDINTIEDLGIALLLVITYMFVLLIFLIALFGVWTYYEYQWHSSLYELIKNSYMSGILGDDNLSKGIIRGAQEVS